MNTIEIADKDCKEFHSILSPSIILGIYTNAISTTVDKKVILIKGIYQQASNQKEYAGYYYDGLRSQNENKSIRLKIPSLLRCKLDNNNIYILKGYLEKKINGSSIELILVIDDILKKEENQISEQDVKRFDLLQKKIAKGYRDIESLVKERVFNSRTIRIANIYGNSAVVDKDFDKGVSDAVVRCEIDQYRCSFASKSDIIKTIQNLKSLDYDVIALVRGGGDKASLEIFDDPELGLELLSIKPILVTALGHTVDETLMDKIADKKFALPHDYGNSLKVWVDQAVEIQSKSKSIFIEQVKRDFEKTFHDQITTLKTQLEHKNKEFETAQIKFKEMVEQNQKDKTEIIQAKEKAIESTIKSLTEQLKAKEESLKTIQENNTTSTKHQINAAIAEYKTKYEIINNERENLSKQIEKISKTKSNLVFYLILTLVIGLIIGFLL